MNKKIFTPLLIFFIPILQSNGQEAAKLNYTLAKKVYETGDAQRPAALFVQGDVQRIKELTGQLGGVFKYAAGDVASIILPIGKTLQLAGDASVVRMEDNYMALQPLNDSMVVKNRVVQVHAGLPPLPQGYNGSNVVMGILDSGIDFTHPDFKDNSGNTRVKFIWDQTLPAAANTPMPYNYGQEFNQGNINGGQAGAHVDNYFGHGTHVSGVAAGNGLAVNHFGGVAPEADIISVCFNWNLPDNTWLNNVADAVQYVFTKADSMGKPCVINISAGTYYGSHDALDLQAVAIENMIAAKNGRMVVAAAGNAGNYKMHVRHTLSNPDTAFTWFSSSPNPIYMEMWASQAQFPNVKFTIAADKVSPYYEYRGMIPYTQVSQHIGMLKTDTLKNSSGQRLALIQSFAYLQAGRYSMAFNVAADSTTGYNYRLMTTGSGSFDLWSFQMVSTGLPAPGVFPDITKYVMPDSTQNIVSSFTCSNKVITVGNYINKSEYESCDNLITVTGGVPGELAANSSRGPTRDGRVKPEVTASGTVTLAPIVIASIPATPPSKIAKLGCMHMRDGGTSTSAPVVAGITALYLQRYPNATWQQIKNAITLCTYMDNFVYGPLPNSTWGYGKADAFAALTGCAALGMEEPNAQATLSVTPNPAGSAINISYSIEEQVLQHAAICVYDLLGKELKTLPLKERSGNIQLHKEEFSRGVYFVSLKEKKQIIKTVKLVMD